MGSINFFNDFFVQWASVGTIIICDQCINLSVVHVHVHMCIKDYSILIETSFPLVKKYSIQILLENDEEVWFLDAIKKTD